MFTKDFWAVDADADRQSLIADVLEDLFCATALCQQPIGWSACPAGPNTGGNRSPAIEGRIRQIAVRP